MTQEGVKRKIAAILSADVVGYSRLMEEDEVATVRTIESYRKTVSSLIQQHSGRVVDSPGDNLLSEFASVVDAVQCAVEIQHVIKAKNAVLPEARRMEFRIGINLGDVIEEGDRIYGDGINIAARIEGLADPGGICISGSAYEQIASKLALGYESLGEHTLKNISRPIRVYRIPMEPGAFSLPDKPAIAVLPFVNMSSDPEQEYFSDGMTEEIITRLSMSPVLFVIARNSTFTYKGKPVKVQQVSRELGVRYVVEGSVRKAGNRVRITAQLIDATTGSHLWAKTYDRELKHIFALQDEIAQQIARSVGEGGLVAEQARVRRIPTENLTAYDSLLRGIGHFLRFTKEANAKAQKMFERAIELDPEYAIAYVLLSAAHGRDYSFGWNRGPRTLEPAYKFARKAISLDDSSSLAHVALAEVYREKGQFEQAISQAERALSLNPNEADAYIIMGNTLNSVGRSEEAVEAIKKAMHLDPHYAAYYNTALASAYRNLGQYKEAIASLKEALAQNPDFLETYYELAINYRMAWATTQNQDPLILDRAFEMAEKLVAIDDSSFNGHFELSAVYLYKKQYEKALAEAEKLIALAPEYANCYANLAGVFNSVGRSGEAIEMVEKATQLNPSIPAWYLTTLGTAYALSGRHTEAVEIIKRVFERNPSHENAFNAHLNLAILYVELGQEEDARAEAEEILKLVPNFSVEVWGQRNPTKDQAQIERYMAALRKAGLE
jgi:adenylate cyclase